MFIQVHLLTSYAPSNLNRDDMGRPKTATVGTYPRLRVSSQSLKRAWRLSPVFAEKLAGSLSERTRRLALLAFKDMTAKGVAPDLAEKTAQAILEVFYGEKKDAPKKENKSKSDEEKINALKAGQLAFIGPEERKAVDAVVASVVASGKVPGKEVTDALLKSVPRGADIAMFGRMLASRPSFNVEAAAEVAHAFTVHRAEIEDDYFTAVDDLQNRGEEDSEGAGASFISEAGFGAGLFYLYLCIDMDLLVANLGGDTELAQRAVSALVDAAATVGPSGKRASFASRAYASYVMAERGDAMPRSLSVAFLSPLSGAKLLDTAVEKLGDTAKKMDKAYGPTASARYEMNVETGKGTREELTAFLAGGPGNMTPAAS